MEKNVQLTKHQIDLLSDFTKKKFVKFEDVRFELIDHLASDIESQLCQYHELSFESALTNAYSKFPITGFYRFTEQKQKGLHKYWNRRLWKILKRYFSIPKVLLTLLIFTVCFNIQLIFPNVRYQIFYSVCTLLLFVVGFLEHKKIRKELKEKYLFIQVFTKTVGGVIACSFYGLNFFSGNAPLIRTSHNLIQTNVTIGIISLFLTFNLILIFALLSGEITQLLKDEIKTKYKHLNIESLATL